MTEHPPLSSSSVLVANTANTAPVVSPLGLGGRLRAAHRLSLPLGALWAVVGCSSAHVVLPVEDDAGVIQPDAGPVIEPCPVVYELSEVTVPPIADGVGFNLDSGDSEAGCREDGPGGVDNGIQELDAFISGLFPGFSLNVFVTRASRDDFLEIPAISIDRCSPQPTIQAVNRGDGSPVGAPVPLEIAADGSFFAVLGELSFAIPLVLLPEMVDLTLENVHVRGHIDADDQVTELVIGGTLEAARLIEFADRIAPSTGLPAGLVRGVLRSYLDMDTDPLVSGCEGLSFHVVAVATIDHGEGPGPNPSARFRSNVSRSVSVGGQLRVDIVGADDHTGLSLRTNEAVAAGTVERYLPTLYNGPPYEHALLLGVAVGTTTVELRDGDQVRDTFELLVTEASPLE